MKRSIFKVCFAAVVAMFTVGNAFAQATPPNDEIWYTSKGNIVINPYTTGPFIFGASIISNTNVDGKGIIKFDGNVTSIGNGAFSNCSSLTSITIPNLVTGIGVWAFEYCSSLASITIPNSVTSIGSSAFEGCFNLPVIDNIRYADTYLVGTVDKTKSTYSIKEGTKWIGDGAFSRCSNLTSITIPNSVTSIGQSAFSYCSSLASITLPNSVKNIESYTFYDCFSLTTITLPHSVTNIGASAFSYCSSLITITLPNSVVSIGASAFSYCSSLTTITLPHSVTKIENETFRDCSKLISINMGNSVKSIGVWAFSGCSSLATITIPNSVTSIESNTFFGCSSLASITIPNSVTSIGGYAFAACSSLASITIPNSVTSIEANVFAGCKKLISITIPNSVTNIGVNAFINCSNLTSITIPNSVTSIGSSAFSGCSSLEKVYVSWSKPITIPQNVFDHSTVGKVVAYLYVPKGTKLLYQSASVWADFADIQEWDPTAKVKVENISLNNSMLKICADDTYQLVATVMPGNASNREVTWSSSNSNVVTVSAEGLVMAIAAGSATITCTAKDGSGVSTSCNVTVLASKNIDVKLTASGFATFFSSEYDYTVPAGCKAQLVTDCNDNKLTYETIADGVASYTIPKNTAVMLVATSLGGQTIKLKYANTSTTYSGTNYLHGSNDEAFTTADGNCYFYKLTNGKDELSNVYGWFWGANNGAAFKIDGRRAWLAIPKGSSTRSAFLLETGIHEITGELAEEKIYYDLLGRKVNAPKHAGFYIVNGHKVFINK